MMFWQIAPSHAADQASLYGMITDQASKLPIHGVDIVVGVPGTEPAYRTRTDGFGMYRIEGIAPGTYTLEANHPGYLPGSDAAYVIASDKQNRWLKELTLKEVTFDIFVEVACVTTGMKLKSVPVAVTVTPAGGSPIVQTARTDELGFIHFTGMPKGVYSFSVNTGEQKIPGWESYSPPVWKELTGHHWADVLLKPVTSQIIASVYGFNPVTEKDNVLLEAVAVECEGIHPDEPDIVLVPAQIGVSGIRKNNVEGWDNTMAGKVRFTGLPHVHWLLRAKRLGYRMSETKVTAVPKDDARIDMVLQDTKLTVVVETPYKDQALTTGLKVRLQGLKDTNTAGIDRTRTVTHETDKNRAVVVFDKILPGNYLMTVNDTVIKTVPIIVDGEDIQKDKNDYRPSNRFSVRFTSSDYIDAFADVNREVRIFLNPEPMTFTGVLHLVGIKDGVYDHNRQNFHECLDWHTKPNQKVEIRASRYYSQHMPDEYQLVEATTDAGGAFTVSLIPGLYGVVIPGLDDYFGGALTLEDLDKGSNERRKMNWPYYQQWPYSKKSVEMFMPGYALEDKWQSGWNEPGGFGGVGLSSGQNLEGWFLLPKKQFLFGMSVSVENTLFEVMRNNQSSASRQLSRYFHNEGLHYLKLKGPVNLSAAFPDKPLQVWLASTSILGHTPGAYTIEFEHPDYTIKAGSLKKWDGAVSDTFTWYAFPNPGVIPGTPFPEDFKEWESPYAGLFPLYDHPLRADLAIRTSDMSIALYEWSSYHQKYVSLGNANPQFYRHSQLGDRVFTKARTSALSQPYTMWYSRPGASNEPNRDWDGNVWYRISSNTDNGYAIYIGGENHTATLEQALLVEYEVVVEARNIDDPTELIEGIEITPQDNALLPDVRHPEWTRLYGQEKIITVQGKQKLLYTVYMRRSNSLKGIVVNNTTGKPAPAARVTVISPEGFQKSRLTNNDGTFNLGLDLLNTQYLIEVRADGFEPYGKVLRSGDVSLYPGYPDRGQFVLEGDKAIRLTPLIKPAIYQNTLTMNRRGAFLPGVKKSGNQTVFNDFNADAALTMTWGLDVGPTQKEYTVTLPGFDNADGSPGPSRTVVLEEGVDEVWLVDMKAFPNNRYNEEPVTLTLPGEPEPAEAAKFLANVRAGATGFKNVYFQRLTQFTADASNPDIAKATGQVKLWQLPPDQFRPAFFVVTKLGAVNVYLFEYTGNWAGKELTGARLPPWFAGIADIMGSVAGSQAMLGEGLMNALPKGKIMALPSFTANIVLRATNAVDYIYGIDTQVKEGMLNNAGGVLGLAPGFMGLSLYGGVEATLKGEDREFYLQMKGGVSKQNVNKNDYKPEFHRKKKIDVKLTPPPSGEIYHIDSYKFDPDNRPHELAVLYGVSGQTGVEVSATVMPVLKLIPKIGPVLYYMLYETGAMDIRATTNGLIGVRSLSGFKTTFPHQEEHFYETPSDAGSKQLRRHFLGGNELGDPVKAKDPEKTESLDIALGFGVGMDVSLLRGSLGAKGKVEMAGDDAWTGAPAMLIDLNPDADWPIVKRIRGDVRATLDAYVQAWIARFQKRYVWKAWPIDHQFGTESVMHLIEMEIITERRDLGSAEPSEFKNEATVVVDKASPLIVSQVASGTAGELLLFTDMTASGGDMVLKASLRQSGQSWGAPVVIARVGGVVVNARVTALKQGGWMAVWTEIARDRAGELYPPSRIMYAIGNAGGTEWTTASQAVVLDHVADAVKLVSHGNGAALIYTEKKEGPTGGSDGLNAVVWNGSAWSAPQRLASSAITGFDGLGSDDLSQRPTLVAYTDAGNKLHLLEWAANPSDPLLMKEPAGGAMAFTRHNDRTWLAYSLKDGGIGVFHRDGGSGAWTDREPLFPEARPRELSLSVARDGNRDYLVAAWTESDGYTTGLYYGVMDVNDPAIRGVTKAASGGDFRQPALNVIGTDGALELTALFQTAAGVNQLHRYPVRAALAANWGDINGDGIVDLADFIMMLKILVGDGPATIPAKALGDVNSNGRIDLGDAIYILRVLGKE
jgi:hypothetical protein